MERLTRKSPDCFRFSLKDHKAVVGEFGTYEAFFDYSMAVKKLGEYEDAEEQGLLVIIPCKVGDTVYTESHIKGAIASFCAPDETWIFENRAEFGISLFLTREEAEAALAKEKNNES